MKSGIPWLSLAVALAAFVVEGAAFTVSIDRRTGALTFSDNGKVLLAAVASRAFAVLRLADDAARALAAEGAGEDDAAAKALAEAPRLCGVGEWREASRPSTNAVARFRRAAGGGGAVFLVLRNGGEKPVGFDIQFAALGLDGRVAVLDLVEMAELDLDAKSLKVEAPPSGERKFCLVAWPAAGGAEEGCGGAG